MRADSAFYSHALVTAVLKAGAEVSITVRMDPAVKRAITTIAEHSWTTINYTDALFDETTGSWVPRAGYLRNRDVDSRSWPASVVPPG